MDAERWAVINNLLDEAMERDVEARATFLDEACAGDPDLRNEVESLLKAHAQSAQFLSTPALQLAARQLADERRRSLVGEQFGAYEILSVLGAGGMGEVYLAHDPRLGRKLALKLLPRRFTMDPERIHRFENEARAASALNHPNILTIYETGDADGTYFIASEYVEGETLRKRMEHGSLRIRDAVEICSQVASALAAAHQVGVVHRDVKPENLIVRPDGWVKVLDFGLVKLTEPGLRDDEPDSSSAEATSPGVVIGTFAYMSPEQASGIEVDHRSDVFSLGVLMYQLLSGELPFKGDSNTSVIDAIIHKQPESLLTLNQEVTPEIDRIVSRALEKERELRYQTASDFGAELKRLKRDLDAPPRADGRARTHGRAAPSALMISRPLAAVVAASVLFLAGLSFVLWRSQPDAIEFSPWFGANSARITDFPHEELFPSLSPDGNTVVFARQIGDDWEILSQRVGGFNAQNLTQNPSSDDTHPAFSPDGSYIAFRSDRDGGGIFVMGASGESVRRLSDRGGAYHPAWSPDSREVIYTAEEVRDPRNRVITSDRLWAVSIRTLERRLVTTRDAAQPQWSPNGHRLAYWASDEGSQRDLWTMTPAGDDPVRLTNDLATDWNPVWAPDGKHLYFVSDRSGRMQLWRLAVDEPTGRPLADPEIVPTPSAFAQHVSLSKEGNRLVFAAVRIDRNLYRVEIDSGPVEVIRGPEAVTQWSKQGRGLDVSPDGERLVFDTMSGNNEDLAVLNSDGSEAPRWLTDDEFKDRGPRWSPDGKRIAFYSTRSGSYEIWLINADGTGLRRVTQSGEDQAFNPLWSPDGTKLNFTNQRAETWIIDADQPREQQAPLKLNPERDPPVRFWPDLWSWDTGMLFGASNLNLQSPGLTSYSLETGRLEQVGDYDRSPMEWFRDQRRGLYLSDGVVFMTDRQTGVRRRFLSSLPDKILRFRLSSDNRWVYYVLESVKGDIWLLSH